MKAIKFITSNIIPPPKKDVLAFLGIPFQTGDSLAPKPTEITRRAEADVC